MRKILIVNKEQYGYHIDTYKYCLYLSEKFDITYICWDENRCKIHTPGINCIYLKKSGNIFKRYKYLIGSINTEINLNKYDLVFLIYFFGCSFLKILNFSITFNMDIRTISVTNNKFINYILDRLLVLESLFFENITIVSTEIGNQLKLNNFTVLPLGGECFVKFSYPKKHINLIYVGSLSNRNIMDLIHGFNFFLKNYNFNKKITLTIIGIGYGDELNIINQYIKINKLNDYIFPMGYVHNDELSHYFEMATCGISYVPITSYYQNQPPTKTYEYLLSGLPVLATNTLANSKIIMDYNGILIDDNFKSVAEGILKITKKLKSYNSDQIKNGIKTNLWENIVLKILLPYLNDRIIK